ncbi:MAG TPA: hypothetical protein PK156_21480 [Polyangium sp.]|nr:hypothetical protein [Polyangium sp.]
MLRIHMLPAAHGDCLLVEYGKANELYLILIDGGVYRTYNDVLRAKLVAMPETERRIELVVITHVDADHIEGIIKLLADESLQIDIGDIWFNGYGHLTEDAPLNFGGVQGECASALIEKRKIPWNKMTEGRSVHVPDQGPLPVFTLPGGMQLTLLSPTREKMDAMADKWEVEVKKAGLVAGQSDDALEHWQTKGKRKLLRFSDTPETPDVEDLVQSAYEGDGAAANGSSIAFLAEFDGKSVLFGADAHAEVLVASLERLLDERKLSVLEVDAFKLPHHGSAANLSPRLVELVLPRQILVSTSGAIFEHPDAEAIARSIARKRRVELVFNYRSEETTIWESKKLQEKYFYDVRYPEQDGQTMTVDVEENHAVLGST